LVACPRCVLACPAVQLQQCPLLLGKFRCPCCCCPSVLRACQCHPTQCTALHIAVVSRAATHGACSTQTCRGSCSKTHHGGTPLAAHVSHTARTLASVWFKLSVLQAAVPAVRQQHRLAATESICCQWRQWGPTLADKPVSCVNAAADIDMPAIRLCQCSCWVLQ
jgi:hypothetical protein